MSFLHFDQNFTLNDFAVNYFFKYSQKKFYGLDKKNLEIEENYVLENDDKYVILGSKIQSIFETF